jgi:hypothetical protein
VLGLKRSDRVVFSRATFSCWNFVGAPQETILYGPCATYMRVMLCLLRWEFQWQNQVDVKFLKTIVYHFIPPVLCSAFYS